MLTLNNLKSPGAHRNIKRIGRGQGSGQGTQAGKGHKGQKARSGGGVRTGFEGGAMPLYMRLPKKGFSNIPFKNNFATISLENLQNSFNGTEVSKETLKAAGLLKGAKQHLPIKILASEGFDKKLTFVGIKKFTKSAMEIVTKAGCEIK